MAYAGKDPRARRTASGSAVGASSTAPGARAGRGFEREIALARRSTVAPTRLATDSEPELDWQHIGIFAAGAVLGVALGAGAALLLAPQSGAEARHRLARRGRHLRERTSDAWDDLRDELRYAARRSKRKLARRLQRAWRHRQSDREIHNGAVSPKD